MSFEWRTDEDKGWQEGSKREKTAVSSSFLQRRWRFLLAALLGIAAVWGVVQWQINQRVTTATVEVGSELLNTHNFVLQTAVAQDEDLFKANLSGRDPAWGEVQKTLLNEGLFLDRPMLGWQHEPAEERLTSEAVTVTVAPDLRAAELLYPQEYAVIRPDGVTETVMLQQTAVYREGNTRWLYAPPLDDFWGDWITQGGDYLTVVYPERDREVATRLAIHLDQLIGQMCDELADLNCDSDQRFHLRLNTDPESLLEINEIETILTAGLRLELPTPTLVGLPTDEAGYEVLYQAYGVQLATAVLAHQIEYDCCRHQLFFRALRDYQLTQLGLQTWPLEAAMFDRVLSAGFAGNGVRYWQHRWEAAPSQFIHRVDDPDPIWQQVYMLVEYLNEQETAVSPTEMMRLLGRNSFHGWARDVLSGNYDQALFSTLFLEYIYAQSDGGQQAEPPIPFPDGEITLVCDDDFSGFNNRVYAYDLASQAWREKFTDLDISSGGFIMTYDGENFILTENSYADPDTTTNRFYLLTEGEKRLLEEIDLSFSSEHFVYYYTFNGPVKYLIRIESDQEKRDIVVRSLDCPTSDCPEIQLAGYPNFSPNGKYVIEHFVPVQDAENSSQNPQQIRYQLSVVSLDDGSRQLVGQSGFGFWVDNETYGFVQTGNDGWELIISTVSQPQPRVILREADLSAEIPAYEGESTVLRSDVFAHPNGRELFLQFSVDDELEPQNHLFRLQLADDLSSVSKIDQIWTGSFARGIGVSPDGRYMILVEYNNASSSNETPLILLDLETGQVSEPYMTSNYGSRLSWSPDGQWFVQNTESYVLLHAPAYDYQHYIPHGLGECRQAVLSVDE